jgi:transposase
VVGTFGVSLAILKRWLRKRREGEDLWPGSSTGRKGRIPATVEERRAL